MPTFCPKTVFWPFNGPCGYQKSTYWDPKGSHSVQKGQILCWATNNEKAAIWITLVTKWCNLHTFCPTKRQFGTPKGSVGPKTHNWQPKGSSSFSGNQYSEIITKLDLCNYKVSKRVNLFVGQYMLIEELHFCSHFIEMGLFGTKTAIWSSKGPCGTQKAHIGFQKGLIQSKRVTNFVKHQMMKEKQQSGSI